MTQGPMKRWLCVLKAALVALVVSVAQADQPIPTGAADVTFSYVSSTGVRTLEGQFDYSGTGPGDATPLGGDPNIGYFNAVNSFGRRTVVPSTLGPDESLLTHAFFKPPAHDTDFFADIVLGSDITLSVQNIHFDAPVFFQQDTVLMHKLWDSDQLDLVDNANPPFLHLQAHNHETLTDPFRDFDAFFPNVFSDVPPNYRLGTLGGMQISGDGTDTFGFSISVPYELFRHQEEDPNGPLNIPAGLPAPHGFLEPFHFHLELVVSSVPEPTTAGLLLAGSLSLMRIRRKA